MKIIINIMTFTTGGCRYIPFLFVNRITQKAEGIFCEVSGMS